MPILPALLAYLARKRRESATIAALERLDDRRLADIGLERDRIRAAARQAARSEPSAWTRLVRARRYWRERQRVLTELRRYSDAELARDGLFARHDFAALAHEEARRRVAFAGG
jgi:uncharacterized protein YjiS (DUF1127 family)